MIRVAITIGDPNGVGPEITRLALQSIGVHEDVVYFLFSHPALRELLEGVDRRSDVEWVSVCETLDFVPQPGESSLLGGRVAYESLVKAVEYIRQGKIDVLVTAPLAKYTVHQWNNRFYDHTTFLGEMFAVSDYRMAFWGEHFGVVLDTIHVPLRVVPSLLSASHLETTLRLAYDFLRRVYGGGVLALCGLNPHAGEGGLLGDEEETIMKPLVQRLVGEGLPIEGPLPADTVFYKAQQGVYKMVVALYHDQGLAPFKMLHFDEGVNVTLGLPFVRTSPDHGTAFSLAGKGLASSKSMEMALRLALRLVLLS